MLEVLAYLSWMTRVISGGSALGSLMVMRAIPVFGFSMSCRP